MRTWRNWQTRRFQVPVGNTVWVQIPSSAPSRRTLWGAFLRGADEGFISKFRLAGIVFVLASLFVFCA